MNQFVKALSLVVTVAGALNPALREVRKKLKKLEEEGVFSEEVRSTISNVNSEKASTSTEANTEESSVTDEPQPQTSESKQESKKENLLEGIQTAVKNLAKFAGLILDILISVADCLNAVATGTAAQV